MQKKRNIICALSVLILKGQAIKTELVKLKIFIQMYNLT